MRRKGSTVTGKYERIGSRAGFVGGTFARHAVGKSHGSFGKDLYVSAAYIAAGTLGGRAVGNQIDKYKDRKTRAGSKPGNRVGRRTK